MARGPRTLLCQGVTVLAELTADGVLVLALLVTSPQLWEAANDLLVLDKPGTHFASDSVYQEKITRLKNMVAKSVGKDDWRKVIQG